MSIVAAKEILQRLEQAPELLQSNWCVPREAGRFLYLVTLMLQAQRICEIGTSIGYSTLWLAMAAEQTNGLIDTIDAFESRQNQAKQHLEAAGLSHRANFHLGQALTVLERFQEQSKLFDLVFIDAAKKEYLAYLQALIPIMPSGACLIADNTQSHRSEMTDFIQYIEASPQFDCCELETPNGQLLARKR